MSGDEGRFRLQQFPLRADQIDQVELLFHQSRQIRQANLMIFVELSRLVIDQAERTDLVSRRPGERVTGIEPDAGSARHQRIVGKPGIQQCVRHDQRAVLIDGVSAERDRSRGLVDIQPLLGFEPLPFGVDERDVGDRYSKHVPGQPDQRVEPVFAR